jgi:predicted nucleic acid-binding protein
MNFVLDCSVTMTWFFEHEASRETDELLVRLQESARATVAQHWALEVTNVLLGAERSKRTMATDTAHFLGELGKLPIESDAHTERQAKSSALEIARKHKLTSYDAAYLELAMRMHLPLATLDSDLRKAAGAERVTVLPKRVAK